MSRSMFLRTACNLTLCASALVFTGTRVVNAERPLPPLVLTNRTDDCDHIIPNSPNPNCPPCEDPSPYIVPPLYLPTRPAQTPQATPAPTPVEEPSAESETPTSETPTQPERDTELSQPADPDSVFSDERAQRLDKLGSLLNELHKRLRDAASEAADEGLPEVPEAPPLTPDPELNDEGKPAGESAPTAPALPGESSVPPPPSASPGPPPTDPALVSPRSSMSDEHSEPVFVATPDESTAPGARRDGSIAWIHETAVDHPVDRLALADNLYAAGETALALNVYAEIDTSTMDAVDRNWVVFQLAGCYRRLGQTEEASSHYRQIVSIDGPAWMIDMARWWLMALDKRAAMSQESDQLDATLKLLEEQVGNEIKPGT